MTAVYRIISERTYCGDFVFEGDSLLYANFGGGYFDGDGQPHYRHSDFQGNITMVTDCQGQVEQHTGYYPYGEPWREPDGQPYLYGGKERMRDHALNEYEFGPRRLSSALCLWTAPDPLAANYGGVNPYAYCADNPIKFVDPTGCTWKKPQDAEELKENISNRILSLYDELKKQFMQLSNHLGEGWFSKATLKYWGKISDIMLKISKLNKSIEDIDELGNDPNHTYMFNMASGSTTSCVHRDEFNTNLIIISAGSDEEKIHEITHIRQSLKGIGLIFDKYGRLLNAGYRPNKNIYKFIDKITDNEIEAYMAQYSYRSSTFPIKVRGIYGINIETISNIKAGDIYLYKPIREYYFYLKKTGQIK